MAHVFKLGIGILVGGLGSRLGGAAKGLLRLPNGRTIVEHLTSQARAVAPEAPLYLLGNRDEYGGLSIPALPDDPTNVGPLGGLHGLLKQPCDEVLLLGGDLPYLTASVMRRLLTADLGNAVAAATGNPPRWEPMLSRYRVPAALPVVREQLQRKEYGLFSLLDRLGATALVLSGDDASEIADWDTPEDIERARSH